MNNDTNYQKELEVEDLGFLIIAPDKLGVTNSVDDVIAVLGQYIDTPYTVIKVIPGEKERLLEYAHKVVCVDNILNMKNGVFQYPALLEPNTLIRRPAQNQQDGLKRIISRY